MNLTIDRLAGPSRLVRDELQWEICPICGAGGWRFGVNLRTGLWNCFAGRHQGGGGRIIDYHLLRDRYSNQYPTAGIIEIPEIHEILLPTTEPIVDGTLAHQYLTKRNISRDTITRLSLRDWRSEFRVLIPFFNEVGDACYYTARDYLGTSVRKYINASSPKTLYYPSPAPRGSGVGGARHLAIVEGPMDAVAVWQCARDAGLRWDVVALAGRSVPAHCAAQLRDAAAGRRVLVWLDADGPGRSAAFAVARQVAPHAEKVVLGGGMWHSTCKDPADTAASDIADTLRQTERTLDGL
jgi:hypothetical protein